MKPFCDWIGVTISPDDWPALRSAITCDLDSIGASLAMDSPNLVLWRFGKGKHAPFVRAARNHSVWTLNASGGMCAGLRYAGLFDSYLAAIGSFPHRVTRLDASLDLPVDAAPVVVEILRRGYAGEYALSRKAVPRSDVRSMMGMRADGVESGTVYVGSKRGDVHLTVYDKRHERARHKLVDTGHLLRYEFGLGARTGVTLRDASDPASVFWHFASPQFLPCPDGVAPWVPRGSGFDMVRPEPLLPYQRLMRRIESSTDLAALVALSVACGPYGVDFLTSQIKRMAGGAGVSPAVTAVEDLRQTVPVGAAGAVPVARSLPC